MLRTIGLMSGTSLDGVDAAWVETDGEAIARAGPALTLPYEPGLRRDLRRLLDLAPGLALDDPFLADCVRRLTERHAEAVERLCRVAGERPDLLGFHGQTILHRPREGRTWQVGDAALLARLTGLAVAHDFRGADVAAGGQGAPLAPALHAALARDLPKPLAVLNLGGVGNVTWIGEDGELLAFDTGPANGPLDDWARRHTGAACDEDGALALAGRAEAAVLARLLAHPYLSAPPPKSLDRLEFGRALAAAGLEALPAADGAATLVAFAAGCVAAAARHLPRPPREWLVTGGGRRNPAMMRALAGALEGPVRPVEAVGWDGDALEAQAFGLLAARVARGLPLTFPGTTGAPRPLPGGRLLPAPDGR
ncbi:anhydro-N-acetylmuramic acid kinase [Crenalkalicoccus roseus]|uniref:anhydro-N-acetylmuramic acid kinase n=1 Tax=Crenalkalicoccus roseus TaxID=1485588 RepID=UPI0010806344|nr:anhydro-N-acetylmuramic acid kinase [Crenalkalicoccus roseus]